MVGASTETGQSRPQVKTPSRISGIATVPAAVTCAVPNTNQKNNMRNQLTLSWTLGVLIVIGAAQAAEPPAATQPKPKSTTPSTDGRSGSATNVNKTSAAGKVDLNLANTEEIEALPGVGPTIAQAIIKARPFKNVNELTNVAGIGPSKFAALKSTCHGEAACGCARKSTTGRIGVRDFRYCWKSGRKGLRQGRRPPRQAPSLREPRAPCLRPSRPQPWDKR